MSIDWCSLAYLLCLKPYNWMSSPWEEMQVEEKRGKRLSPGYSHPKGEGRLGGGAGTEDEDTR